MRKEILYWVMKVFKFDWIVYNYRMNYGDFKVVIAPYCDDETKKEEILKKEIPFWFLVFIKLLHPRTKLVIKSLITKNEIDAEMRWYELANSVY